MANFKQQLDNLVDRFIRFKSDQLPIKEQLYYYSLYLTFVLTLIAVISNYILGLPIKVDLFAIVGVTLCVYCFWLAFIKKKVVLSQTIYLAYLCVALNRLWFFSGGSHGSTIVVLQGFMLMVVFFVTPKMLKIVVMLVFFNVLALFALEVHFPHLITQYSSESQRTLDVLVTTLVFFMVQLPVLIFAKQSIVRERNQAIHSEAIKTSFFLNLSHEIRTPMNAILGFSELLEDDDLTQEQRKQYISIVSQNGRSLLSLLNNVISFSKLESNQNSLTVSKADACELTNQVFLSLHQMVDDDKKFDFRTNCPEGPVYFTTDVLKAYQILLNITFNAIKFTERGFVEIGFRKAHNQIVFFIKDTGCGISSDAQIDIFDRFMQAEQTLKSSASHGAGLGLAICKRLALLVKAQITLESEVGKGTTFYVAMPIAIE